MPSLNRTVARVLVVSLCTLGVPIPAAQSRAGLQRTGRSHPAGAAFARALGSFFDRADVRAALERRGVSADDAKARVGRLER